MPQIDQVDVVRNFAFFDVCFEIAEEGQGKFGARQDRDIDVAMLPRVAPGA